MIIEKETHYRKDQKETKNHTFIFNYNIDEFIKLLQYKYKPYQINLIEAYYTINQKVILEIDLYSEEINISYYFYDLEFKDVIKYLEKNNIWSDLTPATSNHYKEVI